MSQTIQRALTTVSPTLRRLHPVLGAELVGIDLDAGLDAPALGLLRQALHDHVVVVLPGQHATPRAQLALTRQLGRIQSHPLVDLTLPEEPEIVVEDPARDTLDLFWHADLIWSEQPNRFAVLSCAPPLPESAVIEFCSQVAAYDRLDPWLKDRIEYLQAEHDHPRQSSLGLAAPRHPLVQVDGTTGRRALMPGGATARRVPGLAAEDSDDLLHRLRSAATHPAVTFTHRWRPGDVVVWDNLAALHRHGTGTRTRLHRTMVEGARPLGPAALAAAWMSAG